jgi:4,5-DOPA dioxygenase extradiol
VTPSHQEFSELIEPGGALVEDLEQLGVDPEHATEAAESAARSTRAAAGRGSAESGEQASLASDDESRSPRMPAIYLGHGAPPLLEDPVWMAELAAWSASMPRPRSILIVSAHWESQPISLSATTPVPLVYDFYGFPEHYYRMRYDSPAAPELADRVRALMPAGEPVVQHVRRGLDHGAWVPLKAMYPDADIPVLQMSMPDLDPGHLFEVGRRLSDLRDEGVLIVGSGFLTHGLPFIHEYFLGKPGAPQWSIDFDHWAREALNRGDIDELFAFRDKAPGMPWAHPTVEHFAPLFVTLGAAATPDAAPDYTIEGYFYGLSKRSFEAS